MRTPRSALDWLTARPIAHRGLHGAPTGLVENSTAAAEAAIAAGYAIECDVQRTADDAVVVFHDFDLDRLTLAHGRLSDRTLGDLDGVAYRGAAGRIPALSAFLATIAGRVPLIVEIKSAFDGDMRLADRTAAIVAAYPGPIALKSFDMAVLVRLRAARVACPIGLVAQAKYEKGEWSTFTAQQRIDLATLRDFARAAPDFLSWHVNDLPHAVPTLCRDELRLPVMTWTVRTPEQREVAARFADQMIFEGFAPQ